MSIRAPSRNVENPRPAGINGNSDFFEASPILRRARDRPRRFIGRIYTYVEGSPSLFRTFSRILSIREDGAAVNESVQSRRSKPHSGSKDERASPPHTHTHRADREFRARVENAFSRIRLDVPYDRLNRDNPGERSEHTSPVSGIITLFRSKPRYRSRSLLRAIPLRSLRRLCFLLLRSAYFLSAGTHHRESFFPRRKQFRAVEPIDRISNLLARLSRPRSSARTLRSYVSLLLPGILFRVLLRGSSLFIVLLYSFRREGERSDESGRSRDDPLNRVEPFILHHAGLETRRVFHL